MKKIYYISVYDDEGNDCMVSYDNEPTWNLDNAMTFETSADATLWTMSDQAKEWTKDTTNRFVICETEIE